MVDHESAVRAYLSALADPSSLMDEEAITSAESSLAEESDPLERVRLQQELIELRTPSVERAEDAFVTHAKAWAEAAGVTAGALSAEGVANAVLRRAGFTVSGGRGRSSSRSSSRRSSSSKRVTTEEVIEAMPSGTFTVKMLQEASGASPGVVRKAIGLELEAGRLTDAGTDPDHSGPGRAPTLYRR